MKTSEIISLVSLGADLLESLIRMLNEQTDLTEAEKAERDIAYAKAKKLIKETD